MVRSTVHNHAYCTDVVDCCGWTVVTLFDCFSTLICRCESFVSDTICFDFWQCTSAQYIRLYMCVSMPWLRAMSYVCVESMCFGALIAQFSCLRMDCFPFKPQYVCMHVFGFGVFKLYYFVCTCACAPMLHSLLQHTLYLKLSSVIHIRWMIPNNTFSSIFWFCDSEDAKMNYPWRRNLVPYFSYWFCQWILLGELTKFSVSFAIWIFITVMGCDRWLIQC